MKCDFFKDEKPLTVFISGQKYFAEKILSLCLKLGYDVKGVCCPLDDKYIGKTAIRWGIPIVPAGSLNADRMLSGIDLGIAVHSFDYVGRLTRYKARLGWIGFHPSLLPRHRGRSSIQWTLKMRDTITGGTVFWLNGGIDRGDIAYQDWRWIDPKLYGLPMEEATRILWREILMPLGEMLMEKALIDIKSGIIIRHPQENRYSTFEPSLDNIRDIYKPDLLMLTT